MGFSFADGNMNKMFGYYNSNSTKEKKRIENQYGAVRRLWNIAFDSNKTFGW